MLVDFPRQHLRKHLNPIIIALLRMQIQRGIALQIEMREVQCDPILRFSDDFPYAVLVRWVEVGK